MVTVTDRNERIILRTATLFNAKVFKDILTDVHPLDFLGHTTNHWYKGICSKTPTNKGRKASLYQMTHFKIQPDTEGFLSAKI